MGIIGIKAWCLVVPVRSDVQKVVEGVAVGRKLWML